MFCSTWKNRSRPKLKVSAFGPADRSDGTVGRGKHEKREHLAFLSCNILNSNPRHSMYAIYAYIGVVLGVNVGIYGIHGESGNGFCLGSLVKTIK